MIRLSSSGNTDKTEAFLKYMQRGDVFSQLESYGQEGVNLLSSATPVGETGQASASWYYQVLKENGKYIVRWYNNDVDDQGVPIVILVQYGHGTGTGGYVEGRDFINPVMQPLFDRIADDIWKAVTSA